MIQAKMKAFFFDSPAVMKAVDAGTRRVLSKFGANTRSTAMKSMPYQKDSAKRGQPPHVHRHTTFKRKRANSKTGKLYAVSPLRELIQFAYEPDKRSVVIGPELFTSAAGTPGDVPDKLEHVTNPFMQPAFEQKERELPDMWRNSIY